MIKRMWLISIALFFSYGLSGWAKNSDFMMRPGPLFKVSAYVNTLTINSTILNWTYPTAGIKILTPGYTVSNMSPTSQGFHLFSVSDTVPAALTLSGPSGKVNIKLCLKGTGTGSSCETMTVTLTKQKYAYIASGFTGILYQCRVKSDGTLDQCKPAPITGAPAWIPQSITFAIVNKIQYAYVASWPTGIVYQCTINSEGSLGNCNAQTPGGSVYTSPSGVTFAQVGGVQYAYVSDDVSKVFQCSLNTNGTFKTCNSTPLSGTPAWIPVSTSFATVGGTQYAYVAGDDGHVYHCTINAGNGTFNQCESTPATGAPVWLPKSVTFATFGANQYAYVSDDNGNVFQCTLNSNGTFRLCSIIPLAGAPEWNPRAISFETIGGVQYAYVVDFGSATSLIGGIYQCTLDVNGHFTDCVPTPTFGMPNWGNLWWVAFN